jgi:hypothetical protein
LGDSSQTRLQITRFQQIRQRLDFSVQIRDRGVVRQQTHTGSPPEFSKRQIFIVRETQAE